ncbi:hypothetical protein SNL152K_568 [Streptomyces sp. NL15-2K]|nr:hypothetical protein SNL152K_568 [Streptomyces sp. NL15-2K]
MAPGLSPLAPRPSGGAAVPRTAAPSRRRSWPGAARRFNARTRRRDRAGAAAWGPSSGWWGAPVFRGR